MNDNIEKLMAAKSNKRTNILFVLLLFVTCNFLSGFIPPFQSPDEFEHVTRGYLFGRGVLVLEAPKDEVSGGYIDTGLARYMDVFSSLPFHPERKVSDAEIESAKKIKWEGTTQFKRAPGMAFYFPAIYSVHTLGLTLGKHLDLTVDATYKLTRFLLLLVICCILYFSFQLYQPSFLVMALLIIPMSLFQFSSASLDGITTALSIFIVSAFLRLVQDKEQSSSWLFYALLVAWLLVASSRVQQCSLILLVASCAYFTRRPRYVLWSIVAAIAVVAWQILAVKTSVDGRVNLGASTSQIVSWYLSRPQDFITVMQATLSSSETWRSYLSSFFGMLGWLDAPFAGKEYIYLLALTSVIGVCSVTLRSLNTDAKARLLLVICVVGSVLMIYFALLVTWTPHPATVVHGVVGRYFLIPAIMIAYALADAYVALPLKSAKRLCGLILLICLSVYSIINTTKLLSARYYEQTKLSQLTK